jgi:uncharacterized protein YecE (DUF72 family)
MCAWTCRKATAAPSRRSWPPPRPAWPSSACTGTAGKWDSRDSHERFGYRYTGAELTGWAPKVRALARDAGQTRVLFSNCYRDDAQVNAQGLTELLRS